MDKLDEIKAMEKEDLRKFLKSLNKYQAAPCKVYNYGNFNLCPDFNGNCEDCFDAYLNKET